MADVQGDPYALVLNDLREKRDRLNAAIAAIEEIRGIGSLQTILASEAGQPSNEGAPGNLGAGAFLGMSIPDATKKLLTHERRAMANPEIWQKLKAGGLHLNSADPVNTVGSVLSRRFDKVGDLVRVGRGTWGLAEWYPGRSFKSKDDATPLPPPAVEPVKSTEEVTAQDAAAAAAAAGRSEMVQPPWMRR